MGYEKFYYYRNLQFLFALTMMVVTFIVAFLAVFVPLLVRDMHIAPHDGQGGMNGAFLGLPIAAIFALLAGPFFYVQAVQRHWFEHNVGEE